MKNRCMGSSLSEIDLLRARSALEAANVPGPYIAIVDPKYTEEDIIKILNEKDDTRYL